jgi:Xaa-Pro aminopeptidase
LQAALGRLELDAVVLRLAENILLASGWFAIFPGATAMLVPAEGEAVVILPANEADEAREVWSGNVETFPWGRVDVDPADRAIEKRLRDLADQLGLRGGAIGIEEGFETIAPGSVFGEPNTVGAPTRALVRSAFGTERLVDVTETLEQLRAVKTDTELDLIRRTSEIATAGLNAFKRAAVPGATEIEVMAAVDHAIAVEGHGHRGARWVRGFATVASGPRLVDGWQYFRGTTRTIEPGDAVMLELATVADGYWTDNTRTVVAGKAAPQFTDAYDAVRDALVSALAAARPGATGGDVDAAARATCAEHGFEQYPHHTGHGLGFRYHESRPALVPGSTAVLANGNVVAAEPGIYGPELRGGVRHEDVAVVTADGAVVLGGTDYGLDLD